MCASHTDPLEEGEEDIARGRSFLSDRREGLNGGQ